MEKLKNNTSSRKMILLPLDGSDHSIKAILLAKTISRILNLPIHIVHVSEELLSKEELLRKVKVNPKELPEFIITHKKGDPAQVIIEESKSSHLIILCTYDTDTEKMGPVMERVIEDSLTPIILIRPNTDVSEEDDLWKLKKFLIPMDGTQESSQVFYALAEIAEKTKAEIDVLHTFTASEKSLEGDSLSAPFYEDHANQEWSSWSKEFVKRFCSCSLKHSSVNLSLFKGDPAEAIINFYKENNSDLIAIAWKGKLWASHAEVLKKILKNSSYPLLLVKINHEKVLQKPKAIG